MNKKHIKQGAPHSLRSYREVIDRASIRYKKADQVGLTKDAAQKFTTYGEVRPFSGWSLVYFSPVETEIFYNLTTLASNFRESMQKAGISGKFSFLPMNTYHITLVGIATNQTVKIQNEIVKGMEECFEIFKKEKLQPLRIVVRGELIPDGSTIIAPIEPADQKSLDSLYHIRNIVRTRLHPLGDRVVVNEPHNFHGHISLAYIVQDLSKDAYTKLKEILKQYEDKESLGVSVIDKMELSRFETMEKWGTAPLQQIVL